MAQKNWFYEKGEGESEPLPLTLRSLMTSNPQTLAPTDLVLDAMNLMKKHDIHHIPIVAEGGALMGLITETDILRKVLHGKSMSPEESYHATLDVMLELKELMVFDPETLPPEAPVVRAIELFLKRRFRSVPIVDDSKKLLGIVTETDLLRLLKHMVEP